MGCDPDEEFYVGRHELPLPSNIPLDRAIEVSHQMVAAGMAPARLHGWVLPCLALSVFGVMLAFVSSIAMVNFGIVWLRVPITLVSLVASLGLVISLSGAKMQLSG